VDQQKNSKAPQRRRGEPEQVTPKKCSEELKPEHITEKGRVYTAGEEFVRKEDGLANKMQLLKKLNHRTMGERVG